MSGPGGDIGGPLDAQKRPVLVAMSAYYDRRGFVRAGLRCEHARLEALAYLMSAHSGAATTG